MNIIKLLLLLTAFALVGCGNKEIDKEIKKEYKIKQEIDGKYLYTMVICENDIYMIDYAYINSVEIDSLTDVKNEYLKAQKVLNNYKKIENEIHNINN